MKTQLTKTPMALVFLIVGVFPFGAFAQQKPAPSTASTSCNNEAAVEIIQQQLAETKTYDDDAKRISVLIRAADLLWPYREVRARAAFSEAFDLAIQFFKDKGAAPKQDGALLISMPDMRYTVITAIAKRDSAWARKMTDKMVEDLVNEAKESGSPNTVRKGQTAAKLLEMAGSLVDSDQSASLSFARQTLRFPATMQLMIFIYRLAGVNRPAADQFYQTALTAYAGAPMDQFLYLSAFPFGNTRDSGDMPGYTMYRVPAGFMPNEKLQRLFVKTLLSRVQEQIARPSGLNPGSRITEPEQMWLALTRLNQQIVQTLPDLGPAVAQALLNLGGQLPEASQRRAAEDKSPLTPPEGTFAERLESAEKTPDADTRDRILVTIVMNASPKEDIDTVLSAANKITHSISRSQLLNWFYFTRAQTATADGDLVRARSLAAKVEELDQRGFLYFRIADESLKQSMDQTQAREMLEEVVEAAAKSVTPVSARTLLGVAYLYSKIDPVRSIGVLNDAIKMINRLESPDFSRPFVVRRIEGKTFSIFAMFSTPGFNPENGMLEVSRSDFDGTLYLASNFSSKPLRALTTLAVVEPCLKVTKRKQ
ncbi:MAG TPA: hypothetical protein VNO50_08585 [Pyrinomonadaceae bacterium]|nr:hypothetical protein [Pyrinomonadaceae bacterium]